MLHTVYIDVRAYSCMYVCMYVYGIGQYSSSALIRPGLFWLKPTQQVRGTR